MFSSAKVRHFFEVAMKIKGLFAADWKSWEFCGF